MVIEDLLAKRGMTKYKLAVQAGIPHPTLSDICSGKTKLEKCSAETVYKLSQVLGVSMEQLTEDGIRQTERERAYEYGLPDYLQHDLDLVRIFHSILFAATNELGCNASAPLLAIPVQTARCQVLDNIFHKFLF